MSLSLNARAAALPPAAVLAVAVTAGSGMDATIKYLALSSPIITVIFARYALASVFSWFIWKRAGAPRISAEMWRANGVRGIVIAAAASLFFWALTVLPLAEAVTYSFIYPLIMPFVARLMLGERIRITSIVSAGLGFVGVLVATQGAPSAQVSPLHWLGVAAVLTSASLFSLAMILMRARARADGVEIANLMTSVVPGLILALPALLFGGMPHLTDWPVFLLMGALAATFMYLVARAYANAEAQTLAPIHYTELVWASLIGFVVFNEAPRMQVFAGAALIIAACLYLAYDGARAARAAKEAA